MRRESVGADRKVGGHGPRVKGGGGGRVDGSGEWGECAYRRK